MISRFKTVHKGVFRLMVIGFVVYIVILGINIDPTIELFAGIAILVLCALVYWIALRIIIWVYDGFVE